MAKAKRRSYRRANIEVTEVTYLPGILDKLQELVQSEVHIGVEGDAEVGMIAGIHEFGSIKAGIPSRSFIGSGKKKSQAAIAKTVRAGVKDIVLGNLTARGLYKSIGKVGLDKVLRNFDRIKQPPLSPIYARRKTNRRILQDQEKLRDAITYTVVKRRGRR
ncbi:hypothetical protein [Paenibacillus macerans]|uniref:hypothetical protein n=1 Tax=Paenibacillus macerans TaxID=44252 RepID=UPI003D3243FD